MLGFPEGLAQYIATTATVIVTDSVMKPEGLKFTLLGQGDNILQGIEFAVHEMEMVRPSPSEVQRIEDLNATILRSLIREYSSFGLTLKRAETWSHYRASIYGKDIRADGHVLPMSMKRIARGSFSNNESFGTCDNMLSSISSAGVAAIAFSATPATASCVVQIESMRTLSIWMQGGVLLDNLVLFDPTDFPLTLRAVLPDQLYTRETRQFWIPHVDGVSRFEKVIRVSTDTKQDDDNGFELAT